MGVSFCFQKGTKAPQAAGKIHTDFEKGFIMAEVGNLLFVHSFRYLVILSLL